MNKMQRGFTLVETLLTVLIVAVIGLGGYYVWHTQHKNTPPAVSKTSITKTPASQSTASQNSSPQPYLIIKEWGVEIPLTSGINDAYYVVSKQAPDPNYDYVYVGTHSLTALDKNCAADGISAGAVGRETLSAHDQNAAQEPEWDRPVYGYRVGSYYYGYTSPQAACSNSDSATQKQSADMAAFRSAVAGIKSTN